MCIRRRSEVITEIIFSAETKQCNSKMLNSRNSSERFNEDITMRIESGGGGGGGDGR